MSQYTERKIKTFRERFIELCDENPKNDTALAKSLNVSKQTISAWKLGTRSPKSPTIVAIADYFGVTIEWLMGFDVKKHKPRPSSQIVIPDTDMFKLIMENMSYEDLVLVTDAFKRTEEKMKEKGII